MPLEVEFATTIERSRVEAMEAGDPAPDWLCGSFPLDEMISLFPVRPGCFLACASILKIVLKLVKTK